ncbi:MAG: hypothetical protein A2268_07035 [Candidatus Raymondbacteria bacterium RifOxyA12_full_50_37]|uniref:Holliday junction resolvase n=1 Tax=Candidatus Raymondbacteria bacterium RIFOXYD12_FULL_49_13 TaxID=1817890 RepID=A0A1F7FEJ8_UNCRA|nr:MAG: hypothetical protein A2268_07035 [Candidatus Raymondbacteria bacterium RifOxyA12_full_50_37]OGJ91139.1 MAG: hypothetical protein A2248_01185 [Candidatus Raymondbacteria bacterium RIFOXYA2_FULL_49_16]OGJ95193.1 MAG: hypothetical protein A2487_12435 [Candidatus Raymondbacteria bacterium RifOxyC12_full_50_8]OGJ97537.1 MAG: hypothetical protein A2453_01950 [Candidatus Raymondbacteria bacterium RIFOXYC2_FULL_50_21]OGK00159.1 MAG: hypothetical protein A2350_16350 [Candidatus Raymondbacteria b
MEIQKAAKRLREVLDEAVPDGIEKADFILNRGAIAIEIKGSSQVDDASLKGLKAFCEDYAPERAIVVSNESRPRKHGSMDIIPWRDFLERLWNGVIVR